MSLRPAPAAETGPWISLWITALASLLAQLALCQFFTFGERVPLSIDTNPSNIWKYAYQYPPRGEFLTLNWLGVPNLPPALSPFSFAAAHLPPWLFFTAYAPVVATCALLAMAAFLRELDLSRPAALFGGVIYAWQGDLLPFVFPGHYPYITTWPFFALAAWAALRFERSFGYALIAGASIGVMIGMQPDRASIASLLIAALYHAPALRRRVPFTRPMLALCLCAFTALLVSLAAFLALFQSYIVGVTLGPSADREQTFAMATQFSLGPWETLTYPVPGLFGWHSSNFDGPYWGWIGQSPHWAQTHQGTRNFNLAISTTGTVPTLLALLGICLLLPGAPGRFFGGSLLSSRQLLFGRLLLLLGSAALLLSWGYHTPLYRPLFALPLMDKWRNPLKWLEMTNFALAVLGGFGLERIVAFVRDRRWPVRPIHLFFASGTALLFLGTLISYPVAILLAQRLPRDDYDTRTIASIMHTLHVALGFALFLSLLAWMTLIAAAQAERLRHWQIVNPWLRQQWSRLLSQEFLPATLAVTFSFLSALQLGWVDTKFIDPINLANLTASNPLLDALAAEGPAVRVAVPPPQDGMLNNLLQNQFAELRISSLDVSAASRIPDRINAFLSAFRGHPARLWFLSGVKNVAVAQEQVSALTRIPEVATNIVSAPGYTLYGNEDGDQPTHSLVGLRDFLPKATFVPNAEAMPDTRQLQRMLDPKWNPRETILLDATPSSDIPGSTPEASVKRPNLQLLTYNAHTIHLKLAEPQKGYVLLNDAFDQDWQVEVNGHRESLLKADYLLRAIPVGAGVSDIILRYVAHYHLVGLSIPVVLMNDFSDGVMLLAFLVGGVLAWREQRLETRIFAQRPS